MAEQDKRAEENFEQYIKMVALMLLFFVGIRAGFSVALVILAVMIAWFLVELRNLKLMR